jgi:hypothetical protein
MSERDERSEASEEVEPVETTAGRAGNQPGTGASAGAFTAGISTSSISGGRR